MYLQVDLLSASLISERPNGVGPTVSVDWEASQVLGSSDLVPSVCQSMVTVPPCCYVHDDGVDGH